MPLIVKILLLGTVLSTILLDSLMGIVYQVVHLSIWDVYQDLDIHKYMEV